MVSKETSLFEHYPRKLVRKEKVEGAGFMCALLMPLMCFPRHPLSNYFAKGQEVLSSISKQPHLPSTIWNLVISSKSHKEKNIQSKWLLSEEIENNNIFLHNWNIFWSLWKSQTIWRYLLFVQKPSAPNKLISTKQPLFTFALVNFAFFFFDPWKVQTIFCKSGCTLITD